MSKDSMDKQEILLSDMSQCQPAIALSIKAQPRHWQLVTYRTDEVSGTMIFAREETCAPEIILPLKLQGWYAIYLAFMEETWAGNPLLKVKLTNDPCFTLLETENYHAYYRYLEEGFWKIAELTGQGLVIVQQTTGEIRPVSIAYVRLVPLTEEEARRYKYRPGSKRLIAMNDAWSFYFKKGSCSVQDIQEEIEPYRDTDFGKIFWEAWGGDKSYYPAKVKVGALFGQETEDFLRPGDRRVAKCMQEMKKLGLDPLQVSLERAHKIGLELYASIRMGLFGMCPPAEVFEGPFFREHPELRCRDYDGTEISHLSYAFPEVRRYVLSLLEDTVKYDIDGVNLIFLRGHPYLLYETPLVEGFQQEKGVDPAILIEKDSRWKWYEQTAMPIFWKECENQQAMKETAKQRVVHLDEFSPLVQDWLRYRSRFLTEFMRELRHLLKKTGKGQKVSVVVFSNQADNFFYGIDIETWVKEGLIGTIIPFPWPEYSGIDIGFFRRITKDSNCQIYPNLMPWQMEAKKYLKKAISYYEQGADGFAFWDTNVRHIHLNQWQAIRELGHKEKLKKWFESEKFSPKFPLLRQIGGYRVDRYHPGTGG